MEMTAHRWLCDLPYDFQWRGGNMDVFLKFVEAFGIEKYYTGVPLWPKMFGRKYQQITYLTDFEEVPYAVSYEMYVRWDGSRVFVAHFGGDDIMDWVRMDVHNFADFRGMKVEFLKQEYSWYNAGVSETAVFEIYDEPRYLEYIEEHRGYDPKRSKHWI